MRCARCDRPVFKQAVARTAEGGLVFGWCLACLEQAGCRDVVVARRARRATTRLSLETRPPRLAKFPRHRPGVRAPRGPIDERRLLVSSVALVLAAWGAVLLTTGLGLWAFGLPRVPSRHGNGTPALLIGGGGTTSLVGTLLWALNTPRPLVKSRRALRVVQGVGFLAAVAILLSGVVFRSQARDPLVVGFASAALVVSAAARWIELKKLPALVPRDFDAE